LTLREVAFVMKGGRVLKGEAAKDGSQDAD
jgi:hypothetical protein